jgi:N,N-dimethylformamidase
VHFHEDDIDDIGWSTTCTLTAAPDLPSGVYALRLRAGPFEDHTPFFVRALPGRESRIALVLPTASYMAYADEHLATAAPMGQAIVGHTPALQPMDLLLMEHPELGLSMYELHADGSGVPFSSRRRPILNMRPRHRFSFLGTWQFPSDLYIVDWLEQRGYDYDVLTDEDLHREGAAVLRPYRARRRTQRRARRAASGATAAGRPRRCSGPASRRRDTPVRLTTTACPTASSRR